MSIPSNSELAEEYRSETLVMTRTELVGQGRYHIYNMKKSL